MSWFSVSANEQEAAKERYCMFLAVDFDFPSGHLYLWTGAGELVIGGNTYLGMGKLARASYPSERSALTSERKIYQLAGEPVDPAIVPESDVANSFGRQVIEYFGFLNSETMQLLADPEVNFVGHISNISRSDGASPTITVSVEDETVLCDQVDGWRYTHEHQQLFYAGDQGFREVASIELTEILWGGRRLVQTSAGGRNGIRGFDGRVVRP